MSQKSEIRDGMRIDWNVPIPMDDGIVLRADVYRPIDGGAVPGHPVLRGLRQGALLPGRLSDAVGEDGPRPSGDPGGLDQQVPELGGHRPRAVGSARLRRGARRFPGRRLVAGLPGHQCPREIDDLYQCIEWAGTQPWSNGKVGMLGISYYASNQWRVAAKHPPHLAAIIPWEGFNDNYRDSAYHGGILCEFMKRWASIQVMNVQYGLGERAKKNPNTGESIAGPVTLCEEELAKNRVDPFVQTQGASARRRVAPLAFGRPLEGDGAVSDLRQLGRPGHSSARQLQRLHRDALEAEVARGPRRLALVAVLQRLRPGAAEAFLRLLPQRHRQRLGASSRRCSSTSATRERSSSSGWRTSGRWPAPSGQSSTSIRPA